MSLEKNCVLEATAEGRELAQHGSTLFPIACYAEDLTAFSVPWHWHEDFEYILAAEGRLLVEAEKNHIVLEQGQGVFLNSGALHRVTRADGGPALLHSGVFHPRLVGGMDTIFWQKLVQPMLRPGMPSCFLLDGSEPWQQDTLARLRRAWDAVTKETDDYENLARYCLSAAVRTLGSREQSARAPLSRQEQIAAQRMKQMLLFIETHYAEELTVERIAGSVALSESACLRSFRQMLGTTPIQYVKQYRVERAAELLHTTCLKTGEIGAECGFADGSYFIKTFREIKHCTPREYRQYFAAKEP